MISGRRTYRRNLPHFQSDYRTYFVTFGTKDRWVLPGKARDVALCHIAFDHLRRLKLHAAVVMPDHVHILFTPLSDRTGWCYSLSKILQGIKGSSAREINLTFQRTGPVWQHESFDHEVRSDESLRVKAEYVCANPVRRGLVATPDEYRWIWREWIEGRSRLRGGSM